MILPFIIGLLWGCAYGQRRPPNYGQGHMPETAFSCRDKIIGGYYADPETDCQMFHVCVKIPGKGVQDFRFLCPNDTSFDQENQICDDWYNIDCEASTLYYSDNFDLYRLGGDLGRIGGKLSSVNNAVGESLDDNYLHKADRGDNVPQDLLRGSQSGNFFSNRNGGREDYDDDDYKPKKKQAHDKTSKQIKKPQEVSKDTSYHVTKEQSRFQHRNSNFRNSFRNQHVSTEQPSTEQPTTVTTAKTNSRGSPYRQDFFRQRITTTIRPTAEQNSYSPTTTTTVKVNNFNYAPTTLRPQNNYNQFNTQQVTTTLKPQNNQNYNQYQFNNQPVTTLRPNFQQNNNQGTAITTVRPTYYNNYQQHQNQQTTVKNYVDLNRQQTPQQSPQQKPLNNISYQPNNVSPTNFQQSFSTTPQQNNFNSQKTSFTTTTAQSNNYNNAANNYNYNNQVPQNNNNYNAYTTAANVNYNQNNAYTQKPVQNNYNNNVPAQNAHQAQNYNSRPVQNNVPTQKSFSQSFSESTEVMKINANQYNNGQRNSPVSTVNPSPNYSTNSNFYTQTYDVSRSTTLKPFDYQQTSQNYRAPNHQYPDEQDEFLKTAHSQNLGSSLRKTFNASQAAAFNYIPSGTTGKPKKIESKTTVNDKSYSQSSANNFGQPNGVPTAQSYTPQKHYQQNQFNAQRNTNFISSTAPPTFRTTSQANLPSTFPPQSAVKKVYNQTPDRRQPAHNSQQPSVQKTNQPPTATPDPKLTSPKPFSAAAPQPQSDNNDYDYAYYDSAANSEYEGIGNVEFRKTTPHRNSA